MMIMYVVEHDVFDIHDNMHENIYHNNMMLLNLNVHDKILLKVMIEMYYHYMLDLMKVEKKMN
jgi:hypothetical protein